MPKNEAKVSCRSGKSPHGSPEVPLNGDMGKEDDKGWSSGTETLEEMSDMERTEEGKRTGEDTVSRPLPTKTQDPGPGPSSLRPRIQTPGPSSLRPRIQAPSPLLPQNQESGPLVRSSLSPWNPAPTLCSLRPRRVQLSPTQLPSYH